MSKPNKLPKEVYVYWNEDKDCDPFLLVYDDLVDAAESAGERVLIGTYRLESDAKYGVYKTLNEL